MIDFAAAEMRALLARSDLFSTLEPADLDRVVALARRRRLVAEEVLCRRGDPAEHVYALLRGRVRVVATAEDGKEVQLRILQQGEVFGELGLFHRGERTATIVASEPCELVVIGRRDFLGLVERHPALAIRLLGALSARISELTDQLSDFALKTLPVRLAKRILELAGIYGRETSNGLRIDARISQQDLAGWVGTTREAVNRHLRLWEAAGVIRLDRVTLTIRVRHELERIAGELPTDEPV